MWNWGRMWNCMAFNHTSEAKYHHFTLNWKLRFCFSSYVDCLAMRTSTVCLSKQHVILLFQEPLLTFQRLGPGLGLGPNSDLGLRTSLLTKQKLNFSSWLLSTSSFYSLYSHTFRSSLSSANQLPEVIPVQLSSRLLDQKGARSSTRLRTFQRSKRQ